MKKVDEDIANTESFQELLEDFISQFASINDFINRGVGYAIIRNGQVISAATSFSIYVKELRLKSQQIPSIEEKA